MNRVPSHVIDQMTELARLVAATDITGRVPEHLVDPLLRAEALAKFIVARLPTSPIATSASGIPLTRSTK